MQPSIPEDPFSRADFLDSSDSLPQRPMRAGVAIHGSARLASEADLARLLTPPPGSARVTRLAVAAPIVETAASGQ